MRYNLHPSNLIFLKINIKFIYLKKTKGGDKWAILILGWTKWSSYPWQFKMEEEFYIKTSIYIYLQFFGKLTLID